MVLRDDKRRRMLLVRLSGLCALFEVTELYGVRVDGRGKEGGGKREVGIVVDIVWVMRMGAPVRYDRRNG